MKGKKGLTQKEAAQKLKEFGHNEIKEVAKSSPITILLRQVKKNFIFYLLLAAAIISFLVGKDITGYAIVGVIVLVVTTGFIQEYKAEKAISALRKMILPQTTVIRDGKEQEILSTDVVVDDILVLRSGERIPADCILLDGEEIKVNEAILTGESKDITKEEIHSDKKYSEKNTLYMGSFLVNGKCFAKVIHTGMSTKFGRIAGMISTTEKALPLQDKVNNIARIMVTAAIVISIATGIIMLTRAPVVDSVILIEILILVIAICVSAFPESFPVVLTTTLAVGASKMAKQNAIVNRMSIIETLGETTIICTDKTGTLTMGQMTVKSLYAGDKMYTVTGAGYSSEGEIRQNSHKIDPQNNKTLNLLIKTGVLCNDSRIEKMTEEHGLKIFGSQTEGALLALGAKTHDLPEDFQGQRKKEVPFSSERKMMSVLYEEDEGNFVYVKGAPEIIMDKCKKIMKGDKAISLTEKEKEKILGQTEDFAEDSFRTLALAYKPNKSNIHYTENELVFLGIAALEDPPRQEVKKALQLCEKAKIKVKMITGDNKKTAEAIGKQVGITGEILEGKDLENITDEELKEIVEKIAIFARVKPEQKLKIVKSLKEKGEIVTMTGDGVNDAPALKEAHIGVAMGQNGTDVSRSVADLTLKDDNFATIVHAVKEGRTIFNNIRKFATYQLCTNFAELSIIFVGVLLTPLLGWEAPVLLALQILFLNLVTDNMPAITLGLNPSSEDIMNHPPRKNTGIINKKHIAVIAATGATMALLALSVYFITFNVLGLGTDVARTSALITIILLEVVNAFTFRSFRKGVLTRSPFVNKYLVAAAFLSLTATAIIVYTPAQVVFSTTPLSAVSWILAITAALIMLLKQDSIKAIKSTKVRSFINSLSQ